MVAARALCLVCAAVEGKYKCPRCSEYTCSVVCSREHRNNHPPVEVKAAEKEEEQPPKSRDSATLSPGPTAVQDPPTKLEQIHDTPEYQDLIRRYPMLIDCLNDIARVSSPPVAKSHDDGLENGVKLVRAIKITPGDVRDALREFSALVQIFKSRIENRDQLREQREQYAQDIGRLLREEKGKP